MDKTKPPMGMSQKTERLHHAEWATHVCSAHQTPDPLCRVCNPAIAKAEAEVERLQDVAQDVICDPGSVHLDGVSMEKLQAVRGDATGRFLSESEAVALVGKLTAVEAEVERLQGLVNAALRLVKRSAWVRYKYNPETMTHGYYLRGKWAGETWEDVLTAEAVKETGNGAN